MAYGTDEGLALYLGKAEEPLEERGGDIVAELLEEIRALRRELRATAESGASLTT